MRVTHGLILLGVLGAGCASSGSVASSGASAAPKAGLLTLCADPAKPPVATAEIKLQPGTGTTCKRTEPDRIYVCDYTTTIEWKFTNECSRTVTAAIGERKSVTDPNNTDDPLDESVNLPSDPYPVPASAGTAGSAKVTAKVSKAKNDCYKYQIKIDGVDTDPEIEIRRNNGQLVQCPTPHAPLHRRP